MSSIPEVDKMLIGSLEKHLDEVISLNDDLAQNPELSNEEFESSAKIVQLLRKNGFTVEYPFADEPTGFQTTIQGDGSDEPRIALLAEYDALPGVGHGCGHCASGSISVLSALILNDLKEQFKGRIDLIGTPDEEVWGGKVRMARRGVFNDFDLSIMMHMFNANAHNLPFLALDGIRFEFTGVPSHAAVSPWEGRNALNAIQLLFHASDMMRQHVKPDVRIHGIITKGGKAPNIIPDQTEAEFFTRGNLRSDLDFVSDWLRDCGRAAALATHTEVNISELCPPKKGLTPNTPAKNTLESLYKFYNLDLTDEGNLPRGSSDIGEIDDYCPTFHPVIKVKENIPLHTKEFAAEMTTDFGHKAIVNGAKIITGFILMVLLDDSLLSAIKEDYNSRRQ